MVAHLELPPNIHMQKCIDYHIVIIVNHPYTLPVSRFRCGHNKYAIACEIVDVVCIECTLMCVQNIYCYLYLQDLYFSYTFYFLLIFTLSFQVATYIFDTTVVNVSIDTNSIISRQGTSVSPVEPFAFIYGTIDNSLQALQRENK